MHEIHVKTFQYSVYKLAFYTPEHIITVTYTDVNSALEIATEKLFEFCISSGTCPLIVPTKYQRENAWRGAAKTFDTSRRRVRSQISNSI